MVIGEDKATDMFDDGAANFTSLDREAYDWVMRFRSGTADPDDLSALQRWSALSPAHREAFQRVSRTWKALGPVGREMADEGMQSRCPGQSGNDEERAIIPFKPGLGRRAFLGGAMAASAAGVAVMVARPPLGLWPSFSELTSDYRTAAGEQRRISLSNNVAVDLNTRTSIAVLSPDGQFSRIELLAGEAMVSAKGTGPVTVLAADGRITTADARFNVRWGNQSVCVTCLEGEVLVERFATTLPLPAGRQVVYSDKGVGSSVAVDPGAVTAWQDGLVIFRSTPVADVVAEVNRYRPGRIILTNAALGRRQFNARFRIADIDQVPGQIAQIFGARATTLPGGIVLLG